jgi:diphthamide synthase (EF-2-diphthine--ammonia ligase)
VAPADRCVGAGDDRSGRRGHLVAVDLKKLPARFAGRRFDRALLEEFPAGIDPCGENGEFHSFVAAGPMLKHSIAVTRGETVERDGAAYADLLPAIIAPARAAL